MSTYELPPSILSYCSARWDTDMNKFVGNSPLDTVGCCINSCHNTIDYCYRQCDRDITRQSECRQKCEEISKTCENNCEELPMPGFDTVSDCSKVIGCGRVPVIDTTCFAKNKDRIIECCMKNLGDSQCEGLYNNIMKNSSTISDIQSKHPVKRSVTRSGTAYIIVFYTLCIFMALLAAYIIVKRSN